MSNTVRVGFIGAGNICKHRHLPGLDALDAVEVVAVCNRSTTTSRAVAQEWDIPEIETDWRAMVNREDLDAIFVGTWPYMHKEMAVAALEAGKHVFCQARMCMDLAEADEMIDAAEAHPNQVNMICPPPHRMPWEPFICEQIGTGALGEILAVRVRCLSAANADPTTITWREQREYSGEQILAIGIVAETLHAWVGEYETLSAVAATPIETKTDASGATHAIEIPQIVSIQGTLRNGALITEVHSGLSRHESANEIVIEGSKATLRVDMMKGIQMARAGGSLAEVDVPARLQRGWQVEADFIEAVRAAKAGKLAIDRPVSPDFVEGRKYMAKMHALHRSAATGHTIDVTKL